VGPAESVELRGPIRILLLLLTGRTVPTLLRLLNAHPTRGRMIHAPPGVDLGLMCRIYQTATGSHPITPDSWITGALSRRAEVFEPAR
jgi:hypothetical protein